MLKFSPTTPVKFYAKSTSYTPGQGQSTAWELLQSGPYSTFYCEWSGSYGDRAMSAEALGVKDSATVRTFFNPTVHDKLRTTQVIVVKNADAAAVVAGVPDKNNANVYELWGGVDNVKEENQYMEFRVRRYEGL
jgi:hypothetical protein